MLRKDSPVGLADGEDVRWYHRTAAKWSGEEGHMSHNRNGRWLVTRFPLAVAGISEELKGVAWDYLKT